VTVHQRERHIPEHRLKVGPGLVACVRKVLVHDCPLLGHIQQPVDPRVEQRGRAVLGPLNERHRRHVTGREVSHVRGPVRVAVPLRYPGVDGKRQQLHHRHPVLVAERHETLVEEVLDHDHIELGPITENEVPYRLLVHRGFGDHRAQPQRVHVQRKSVHQRVPVQEVHG